MFIHLYHTEPEIESEREVTIDETPPSSPPTEELVLLVMDNIWRFNDCYSIFNVVIITCIASSALLIHKPVLLLLKCGGYSNCPLCSKPSYFILQVFARSKLY